MLFTPPGGIQCDAQTRASLTPSFVSFTQQEIHMNHNDIIRLVAKLLAQIATIAALSIACGGLHGWVPVALGMLASLIASECVGNVLTDERLDRGIATVRGWFSAAKKAVA